jgi:hypothetical protein
MLYLAEKTGQADAGRREGPQPGRPVADVPDGRPRPMMGQANVFTRYFPEEIPSVIDRYRRESRRLFEVLDGHLADMNGWPATIRSPTSPIGAGCRPIPGRASRRRARPSPALARGGAGAAGGAEGRGDPAARGSGEDGRRDSGLASATKVASQRVKNTASPFTPWGPGLDLFGSHFAVAHPALGGGRMRAETMSASPICAAADALEPRRLARPCHLSDLDRG